MILKILDPVDKNYTNLLSHIKFKNMKLFMLKN